MGIKTDRESLFLLFAVFQNNVFAAALPVLILLLSLQVTIHGWENFTSQLLSGAELTKSEHLKKVAANLPSPPPLSQNREVLQRQVMG